MSEAKIALLASFRKADLSGLGYNPRQMTLQKGLKTAAKILLGVVVLLGVVLLYFRASGGSVVQSSRSPDGKYLAQIESFDFSALDAYNYSVRVYAPWNPFGHEVFGGPNYGADISIQWLDSGRLLITCTMCDELGQTYIGERGERIKPENRLMTCAKCEYPRYVYKEEKWRDIAIRYAVQ